jgi:hypothetical protein
MKDEGGRMKDEGGRMKEEDGGLSFPNDCGRRDWHSLRFSSFLLPPSVFPLVYRFSGS